MLLAEWAKGSVIQTSGTWNHVIDVYLALFGSKVQYDCWIWGSMFQFTPTVEKLKYAFIFKYKIDKLLELNYVHKDQFVHYKYKNLKESVKYNLIAILKFLAVRKSRRLYCLSNLNKQEICLLYNKQAIVDFAIFDDEPQPSRIGNLSQTRKPMQIFTVGRLAENKNIDKLILAFNTILKGGFDARFHIVGTGPDLEKLKALVKKLGISNKVEFHGFVSDSDLDYLFDRNAIFWCFDNADFNLAPLLFASHDYKVVCALPFQKNAFTERCQNFHICRRDVNSLVDKTIEIHNDTIIPTSRTFLSKYRWSSLATRISQ